MKSVRSNNPTLVKTDGFTVHGISVKTNNQDEMDQNKSKIGSIWESFYREFGSRLPETDGIFGIYQHDTASHGESQKYGDGNYEYTCSPAAKTSNPEEILPGSERIEVPAGKYLKFSAKGPHPDTVIQLWQSVWEYMRSDDCPYTAAYNVDYEEYLPDVENPDNSEVNIYVSVR